MFDFLTISRALSDENRVRILMVLRERPLCVCQITAFLDLAPSTTSKHLSILRQSRLITSRKKARWVYYELPENETSPLVRSALDWAFSNLKNSPQVKLDEERIIAVLKAEEICGFHGDEEYAHSPEIHSLEMLGDTRINRASGGA